MKQALLYAADIKRMREAQSVTHSKHLIRDYDKAIKRKTRELQYYCQSKGIDIKEVMRSCCTS